MLIHCKLGFNSRCSSIVVKLTHFYVYIVFLQSLRQNIGTHLDQYRFYHAQVQAESFNEILERVGSLKTRSNALERLQDAPEQRIELR